MKVVRTFFVLLCLVALASACGKKAETAPAGAAVRPAVPENPEPGKPRRFVIETSMGNITIELFDDTPLHRDNFAALVAEKYFDGTTFHRVIPGFMIQGGDPNSRNQQSRESHGAGGPNYTIPAEIKRSNLRGTVAAARTGDEVNPKRESSGSQFYINVNDNTMLDGMGYTVFGRVVDSLGMDVADKIVRVPRDQRDNPETPITMKVRVAASK